MATLRAPNDLVETVVLIEAYGRNGLIVSVCFGPCGDRGGDLYSVNVMDPRTGREFDEPFAASSFADIREILRNEVPKLANDT